MISVLWILSSAMEYRPKWHQYLILFFDFTNWGMFLAVWIAIATDLGKKKDGFCVSVDGGHSHSRECNTLYAAFACAIANSILFGITLATVIYAIFRVKDNAIEEKRVSNSGGVGGDAVRPSDEGTLGA